MNVAVEFPLDLPPGYAWLDDEPAFDPEQHLALGRPSKVHSLAELGYQASDTVNKATAVAASTPFSVLSDEGAEIMLSVARRLRAFSRPAGDRIENMVRGGCYRSRWLRDLCTSEQLSQHMAEIYGIGVAPHPMPVHLGHLNFEPSNLSASVDKWHHDTLPLDFVMMVTDPASVSGGEFEYFVGTKAEAEEYGRNGQTPPRERVVAPEFAGPGYAIALHGDMIVHRAAPLTAPGERITMVNGYVALDCARDDQSRSADLIGVDDHNCLYTEWAKFAAWRSSGRLQQLIDSLEFTDDMQAVADQLDAAIEDVRTAATEMRAGVKQLHHYE